MSKVVKEFLKKMKEAESRDTDPKIAICGEKEYSELMKQDAVFNGMFYGVKLVKGGEGIEIK